MTLAHYTETLERLDPELEATILSRMPPGTAASDLPHLTDVEVVTAVADDPRPSIRVFLERCAGHPLRPPTPEPKASGRGRAKKVAPSDGRTVLTVAPNPRQEGSAAYAGYACWREGSTVDECVARGLPRRYVTKDVRLGRVVLG